ncbi:MAG: alpha/beta hydrolase [Candidatus Melainabacteria bacterium]|nr:alpha/beta hydrolase [Candidatus Melainabacteria bacterium]
MRIVSVLLSGLKKTESPTQTRVAEPAVSNAAQKADTKNMVPATSHDKNSALYKIREKILNFFLFKPVKVRLKDEFKGLPIDDGYAYEDIFMDTSDGEKLHGFYIPAKEATDKVVIYLHGYDQNVGVWYKAATNLIDNIPVNVLLVDYRGYGLSTGSPTREGVINDAVSMYQYLLEKGFEGKNISLHGRSLGGAIALEAASRLRREGNDLKGIYLQSTYSNMKDVVEDVRPGIPPTWPRWVPSLLPFRRSIILNDLFNSEERIKELAGIPVLISHGTKDKMISREHVLKLHEALCEPKSDIVWLEGAGHNHQKHAYTPEYFAMLKKLYL